MIGALLMILFMIAAFCSCSKNQQTEQVKTYYIPPSYYKIAGIEPEVDVADIKAKGSSYCTDVYTKDGGMVIKLTEKQCEKIKSEFTQELKKMMDKILKVNAKFKIEQSPDYKVLTFTADEQITEFEVYPNLILLISSNITQQILNTGLSKWSLHLKFVNCHTGKTVIEGDLPKDQISFGEKEWKASYN